MIVNFITLKWGSKYTSDDVNKIYYTLKDTYSAAFTLTCYTDDSIGLDQSIITKDIKLLRPFPYDCFTVEKVFLFDKGLIGCNVLLDLDINIQKDLKPYFDSYQFVEPRFTINDKPKLDYVNYSNAFINHGACFVNSSFVTWKDDQLKFITDLFIDNKDMIQYRFKDLDTALFNLLHKKLKYHPKEIVYSFTSYKQWMDRYICLYNDSHL